MNFTFEDHSQPLKKKSKFKRNYLACLNCRTRKVKCDLGDVDNPLDPPCARCKRERKECVFIESKRGINNLNSSNNKLKKNNNLNKVLPLPIPNFQSNSFPLLNSNPNSDQPNLSSNINPNPLLLNKTLSSNFHYNSQDNNTLPFNSVNSNPSLNSSLNSPLIKNDDESNSIQNITNNNATMVFLAHVAGKIAKADDRDHISAKERIRQLENSFPSSNSMSSSNSNSNSNTNLSLTNSNSNEAISISRNDSNKSLDSEPILDSFGHENSLFPIMKQNRYSIPPIKSVLNIRPRPQSKLTDIEYIGFDGILTEFEARRLINLFFITMHPFYPFIPDELQDPDVLPGYPMLLCALLTISLRYNPFPNDNDRHIKVHEQLWIYCQRLMSMTVWGESSSRSIGTLFSFLLFTEWNPRAIHFRWSDYANNDDDDSLANKTKNTDEEFAGLSAMKRSEIMSFMLIGTATRLSFLLDDHPLIFISTHISETYTSIGLNKKSMLSQTLSEVDVNDKNFNFTNYQKATIELLQFFSLCYETLYGSRPKFSSLDKYQSLAILDILSPILENWYRKYFKLLKPSNFHSINQDDPNWIELVIENKKIKKDIQQNIERESLILDYYYTKLYLYSLALSGDTAVSGNLKNSKKGRNLRLDELARYSRYVELAYKAAKEVLNVTQRVKKLKLLKFMPVRWVTRIIKSVSFIVKCYLTLTTDFKTNNKKNNNENDNNNDEILKLSVIPVEEIITLLQKTAICLRDATPDELHLCTRYSTILMYLCSQFKTKMKDRKVKNVVDYESEVMKEEQEREEQQQKSGKVGEAKVEEHEENEEEQEFRQNHDRQDQQGQQDQPQQQQEFSATQSNQQQTFQSQSFSQNEEFTNQSHSQQFPGFDNNIGFSNANQQLFDDFFNTNPSETLFNWFSSNNNQPGLDFVDQFTKEIELDFLSKGGKH